uniref:Tf2-1-like SH3-like domain-containing protein n=1 Tax=Cannabis sativa TaxID=3483 RepID=A0A803NN90_CANSA
MKISPIAIRTVILSVKKGVVARHLNGKLGPRFFGPFLVLERIGSAAYYLQLLPKSSIHGIFHVSLLRAVLGTHLQAWVLPPCLMDDIEWLLTPKEVLDVLLGSHKIAPQALIKWEILPPFEDTWEDFSIIQDQFPHLHLENKVKLVGGMDRPPNYFCLFE